MEVGVQKFHRLRRFKVVRSSELIMFTVKEYLCFSTSEGVIFPSQVADYFDGLKRSELGD